MSSTANCNCGCDTQNNKCECCQYCKCYECEAIIESRTVGDEEVEVEEETDVIDC